jgi:hypothetical protein
MNANSTSQKLPTDQKEKPSPGYRTTEFWLSTLAMVLGVVLASGALPEGGLAGQIVGGVLSVLASLGYTASRTQVKKQG